MRCFIAIRCPDELKKDLISLQSELLGCGSMKLVEEENIHMTLRFLGEVNEKEVKGIAGELEFIKEKEKFTIELNSVGVFPNKNFVRVIWVGVGEGKEKLEEIQNQIDDRLKRFGFRREERFHPHFTLARVKSINKERIGRIIQENNGRSFGSFVVPSIDLMESKLSSRGPVYSILKDFPLA